jgi:uncharacterized membrane protein YccF (DUF307 family)
MPNMVVQQTSQEPGCLVQGLWFIFVGWWLGGLLVAAAWALNASIILLPLGMVILNNIPKALALQDPLKYATVAMRGNTAVVVEAGLPQHPFLLRAAFFLLVGWWWSGLWLGAAYALCATVILMPVGLAMFRLTPAMTTLRRY